VDLFGTLRALTRRWWLALGLFFMSCVGLVGCYVMLPWTYTAQASVVFLAAPVTTQTSGGNPYLQFDDSLHVSAQSVGRVMMAAPAVTGFRRRGLTSSYSLATSNAEWDPVLQVAVTGNDPANIQATLQAVIAAIPGTLAQIEGSRPLQTRIDSRTIGSSHAPTRVPLEKIRLLVIVLAVGLVISIGVPVLVETRAERRRART
jgi:hypothetical protein